MYQPALAWGALAFYVLVTVALTVRGALKTKDLAGFAVGNRDIPPVFVGVSLAAQMTSVATFVVNPGLIYAYGVSGFLGYGAAAGLGIVIGLSAFSRPFLRMGTRTSAITVPQWIGARYGSRFLQTLFAVLSLALTAFVVLIVVALAQSIGPMLGIPAFDAAGAYSPSFTILIASVVVFVFGYTMVGGVNTHAYTSLIQGCVMLVVALILILSGLPLILSPEGLLGQLRRIDPNLVALVNPASLYFRNLFEVFVCNFVVGLAIVCQPHIIGKVLYLKSEGQIRTYLGTAVAACSIFFSVMLVGLYARVLHPGIARIDTVVPTYIGAAFSPGMLVFITFGLICAGLSTLEGILISLSTILSTDLVLPLLNRDADDEARKARNGRTALFCGRVGLVLVGVAVILLSAWQVRNPTGGSVAIFGQYGVYLLFTASFFPLAAGMFIPVLSVASITVGVVGAVATYVSFSVLAVTSMSNNPGFLATSGILVGWALVVVHHLLLGSRGRLVAAPAEPA